MVRSEGDNPVTVRRLSDPSNVGADLAADARSGLSATPKRMPAKYFYDARGSQLFDDITRLPEYYVTRVETAILQSHADTIVGQVRPFEILELGSGYSVKTKLLIDAMRRAGSGIRYVPIDISEDALWEAAKALGTYYPWLAIDGYVGDFFADLQKVPRRGRRLVTFLGSTIGNFEESRRIKFLSEVTGILEADDAFLLGVDLVKPVETLIKAYNDSAGVTAEFNRNMLHVLNRELDADFDVDAFEYVARWDAAQACIEMSLRATRSMRVRLAALPLDIEFEAGEELHNEIACKFTRGTVTGIFNASGLMLDGWFTDPAHWSALALARPTD